MTNLWDKLDQRTWYRPLPAMTVGTFLSGETEAVFIHHDAGQFWLSVPGEAGQSSHESIELAMKSGDDVLAEMDAKQIAEIVRSERLDESWSFRTDEPSFPTFIRSDGIELTRVRPGRWAILEGDAEVMSAGSPAELADRLLAQASFSPTI